MGNPGVKLRHRRRLLPDQAVKPVIQGIFPPAVPVNKDDISLPVPAETLQVGAEIDFKLKSRQRRRLRYRIGIVLMGGDGFPDTDLLADGPFQDLHRFGPGSPVLPRDLLILRLKLRSLNEGVIPRLFPPVSAQNHPDLRPRLKQVAAVSHRISGLPSHPVLFQTLNILSGQRPFFFRSHRPEKKFGSFPILQGTAEAVSACRIHMDPVYSRFPVILRRQALLPDRLFFHQGRLRHFPFFPVLLRLSIRPQHNLSRFIIYGKFLEPGLQLSLRRHGKIGSHGSGDGGHLRPACKNRLHLLMKNPAKIFLCPVNGIHPAGTFFRIGWIPALPQIDPLRQGLIFRCHEKSIPQFRRRLVQGEDPAAVLPIHGIQTSAAPPGLFPVKGNQRPDHIPHREGFPIGNSHVRHCAPPDSLLRPLSRAAAGDPVKILLPLSDSPVVNRDGLRGISSLPVPGSGIASGAQGLFQLIFDVIILICPSEKQRLVFLVVCEDFCPIFSGLSPENFDQLFLLQLLFFCLRQLQPCSLHLPQLRFQPAVFIDRIAGVRPGPAVSGNSLLEILPQKGFLKASGSNLHPYLFRSLILPEKFRTFRVAFHQNIVPGS